MAPTLVNLVPVKEAQQQEASYDLKVFRVPALYGLPLRAFTYCLETRFLGGQHLYNYVADQSGVSQVLHGIKIPEQPQFWADLPVENLPPEPGCAPLKAQTAAETVEMLIADGFLTGFSDAAATAAQQQQAGAEHQQQCEGSQAQAQAAAGGSTDDNTTSCGDWRRPSIRDYHHAYHAGRTTPSQVAEHIISFIQRSEDRKPRCAWFVAWSAEDIRRQAAESTERLQRGEARSILEGVPFAVKDVADALPYATTAGTSFLAARRAVMEDAPYVSALRSMGAILLGKTNLHEIGLGVTGLNLRTGTSRNPHNLGHFCGGSSSGSGAVLAAGLCPIAIGSDGGGSIRIPSSFCGTVGLKPTNGRVTSAGAVEVDCTVATMGPMAGCVEDCALLYAVMANHDQWYTLLGDELPTPQLPRPLPRCTCPEQAAGQLAGLKLGIYDQWFNDADPAIVSACREAVELLKGQGAVQQYVVIPELEYLRVAHSVTIASEMYHNFQAEWADPSFRSAFNPDVRLALSTVRYWNTADYIQAQRVRARATAHFHRALSTADVLVTPTTPLTAPVIPRWAESGMSDFTILSKVMQYMVQANMLGLPAIAVPIGTHPTTGLPMSLQLIGRPWQEGTLIRCAAALEAALKRRGEDAAASSTGAGTGAAAAAGSPLAATAAAGSSGLGVMDGPQVFLNALNGQSRGL